MSPSHTFTKLVNLVCVFTLIGLQALDGLSVLPSEAPSCELQSFVPSAQDDCASLALHNNRTANLESNGTTLPSAPNPNDLAYSHTDTSGGETPGYEQQDDIFDDGPSEGEHQKHSHTRNRFHSVQTPTAQAPRLVPILLAVLPKPPLPRALRPPTALRLGASRNLLSPGGCATGRAFALLI